MAKLHSKPQVHSSSLDFLNQINENNNREWFNAHKEEFQKEQGFIEDFADGLLEALNIDDVIETPSGKKSVYRIYRDTRFSKDKTPYKTHWSGSFRRATKYRRGGYYYHIEKGNSFIAGGFWGPSAQDLKQIRDHIAFDATTLREILSDESFVESFETLKGDQLKTMPKGFSLEHEHIDLLRYKQFLLVRHFTDEEVLSESFFDEAVKTFKNMRPFFDYMSEVLTTDVNGIEI